METYKSMHKKPARDSDTRRTFEVEKNIGFQYALVVGKGVLDDLLGLDRV